MPNPFFVIATQNPIESIGVYNLPEAQLDRFIFKLHMTYPLKDEEREVLDVNISINDFDKFDVKSVLSSKKIIELQERVNKIHMEDQIKNYIVKFVIKNLS